MTIRAYLSHACPPEAFSLAENRKRIQLERKNVERVLFRPGLNRFKQLEAAQNRKGADTYRLIEEQYRQAQKELEAKINTWYQRFATNNGVSMAEARRMLRDRELTELKWDVKEYIKRGQENAFTGQWVKSWRMLLPDSTYRGLRRSNFRHSRALN